jgi:hypothetical protein
VYSINEGVKTTRIAGVDKDLKVGNHVLFIGTLTLQVGGVSDETVKYDYGFCATRTIE